MNWVLIVVIALLILYTYLGWRKGLISVVLSLVALIVTVLLTMALTPVIGKTLKNDTQLYTKLEKITYDSIGKDNMFDDAYENEDIPLNPDTEGNITELEDAARKTINMLPLPENIKDRLLEGTSNISESFDNNIALVKENVRRYIAQQLADIIFQTLVFVIVFIVIYIVMQIIIKAANVVSRLPVIHQVNKLAGIIAGAVKGLVIIWIFFTVITILSSTAFAQDVFKQINGNGFLTFLYSNNLIMKFILSVL